MPYRVDFAERATRDLRRIYLTINANESEQARTWFNGLEKAVFSLDEHPARGAPILERSDFRNLLYGSKGHRYRIIYSIDEAESVVTVLHIRHGSRAAFNPDEPDDDEMTHPVTIQS